VILLVKVISVKYLDFPKKKVKYLDL
jgi:hypothetical protein